METEEIIKLLNPWWKENKISSELYKDFKRDKFKRIKQVFNKKQITVITGLRRVGKTTSMYQLIGELLDKKDSKKIFYFNFDKEVEDLNRLLDKYSELTEIDWKKEKIFVFLDEISKLEKWSEKLKLIYDAFPNIKFVISSSSSNNLEKDAVKNLAGRYFLIELKPLNFSEYLGLKNKKEFINNPKLYKQEIKKEFNDYLWKNFPEIVNYKDKLLIKDYLKSTIIDKIVKQNLEERFKHVNKDLLFRLVKIIYSEPGIYLDYENLSKNMNISKKTLIEHIYYLETSYLIRIVKNYRPSSMASSRKMQRAYPYWFSLALCYCEDYDKILENMVGSILDVKYYWREKEKELDFLVLDNKKILPIEVKNKESLLKRDIQNMIYFLKKFDIKKGQIIYSGEDKTTKKNEKEIEFTSFWKWVLE